MATESINWNSVVNGTSAPLPNSTFDNGEILSGFSTSTNSGGYVSVNTSASDPPFPNNSLLDLINNGNGTTAVNVDLGDDTSTTATNGAYDASFKIYDIDAGSSGNSFQDQVRIRALDENGDALNISVSGGGNFTISGPDADGYMTLTAIRGTNSYNAAASTASITINGGPIASLDVSLTNLGGGQNNIQVTDIDYTTQLICFAAGTMIETADGEVAAQDLKVGDMVRTADNGFQPVRWIGVNTLSAQTLEAASWMRPVRISAGALGGGMPTKDLIVSPQHRMLVRSKIAQKMFGKDEVLVAAKQLVILDGIDICDDLDGVTYVHFLCDQHEVVFANGAESESLFTGPEALKSVGSAGRAEIFALFPELQDVDYRALAVRPLTSGRLGRKLAHRHMQNAKALLAPTAH